jgi:serine phosphatase RsbU (regulator of sigma subunit)/streptogramin lyase
MGDSPYFVNFTRKDGLVDNAVLSIAPGSDGELWIGTMWEGVSRFVPPEALQTDGTAESRRTGRFVPFAIGAELANDHVFAIHRAPDESIWFGTVYQGVYGYDGEVLVNLTTSDGLPDKAVFAIHGDADGTMWFGTWREGVSRYDGKTFVNFTKKDGLAGNSVWDIYLDPDGMMWFGTGDGVSRYDGRGTGDSPHFINFTTEDGLAHNWVTAIHRDPDGVMWFGTGGGGVSRHDGAAWASLDTRDGLAGNDVQSIHQDSEGFLWFATEGGITRYRGSTTPPKVRIASVTTDQTYRDLSTVPAFAIGTRVTIEYNAIDPKTLPEKRQYRYRVKEMDSDWRRPTKEASFDYTFGKSGSYTFEVQAIDRDLNYSEPASVSIVISALPFYRTGIFLIALSVIGGGLLFGIIVLGVQRSRSSRAEKLRLQHELEDARQMQLRLLPESAPSVQGFDIAGFSHPAREVGGDFFDYLSLADRKIGIAIADVSDKGLKAAMNAILANGMLHEVGKIEASCGDILSALNADLYPRMERGMFTALGLAILDQNGGTLQWANAAQPYPLIKRDSQLFDIKGSSELPLGMMQNVAYPDWELELQAGDIAIFYTDGIIEAENEIGEIYGTERLEQMVTNINPAIGAGEIISTILQDVGHFVGAAEQYDDMTVVVVKRL